MIRSRCSVSNKVALCLVAALWFSSAGAVELGRGAQAHGFISQALVYSSDNNIGGGSDDGVATDMREVGANLSWRPGADWLVSGQVLARRSGLPS